MLVEISFSFSTLPVQETFMLLCNTQKSLCCAVHTKNNNFKINTQTQWHNQK